MMRKDWTSSDMEAGDGDFQQEDGQTGRSNATDKPDLTPQAGSKKNQPLNPP